MKCGACIDPETKIVLDGAALEAALKDPAWPRCGHELAALYVFAQCPWLCGDCTTEDTAERPWFSVFFYHLSIWHLSYSGMTQVLLVCW